MGDHLLEAYRASFASLLKAQFTPKQLPEGEEGVSELCGQVRLAGGAAAALRDCGLHLQRAAGYLHSG